VTERRSGILLHPTSLPGPFGIGDLGSEAHLFVEFLAQTRQSIWQVLPLGPTGHGDSPYQCLSAFAGNPLLISPEWLAERGLVTREDLSEAADLPSAAVDFGRVKGFKRNVLAKAFAAFRANASPSDRKSFEGFCRAQAWWLEDFALFIALKQHHGGAPWTSWPPALARREPSALAEATRGLSESTDRARFAQYLFFRQWRAVRRHAHLKGVAFMGDVPLFVAHDSADVWARPELFELDDAGLPRVVAGVPPDYFSETGQCWGNPIYRWDVMAADGFAWWVRRFQALFALVDSVRLDHFRGFESYWRIPGGEKTAVNGAWAPGPGSALFDAVRSALGRLPFVAEDLGLITPEVSALRDGLGLPGMAILQFAFGTDGGPSTFLPHNWSRDLVAYTGTHDNDTTVGWWAANAEGTTQTPEAAQREREFARRYLNTDGQEIHWDFIRAALASVADTVIVPLQDVLGLGSAARMNLPGRPEGNWRWRFSSADLTPEIRSRLAEMTHTYVRCSW
jgi:4-alpha-glucanotransferase